MVLCQLWNGITSPDDGLLHFLTTQKILYQVKRDIFQLLRSNVVFTSDGPEWNLANLGVLLGPCSAVITPAS